MIHRSGGRAESAVAPLSVYQRDILLRVDRTNRPEHDHVIADRDSAADFTFGRAADVVA